MGARWGLLFSNMRPVVDYDRFGNTAGMVEMTQQSLSAVRALRVALLLVVALIAALSLVAMHSVAASVSATHISGSVESQPSTIAYTTTHTDAVPHDSETPNADGCPCPDGSNSSAGIAECAPLASPAGVTVVAQLRAECVLATPISPRIAQRAEAVAQPTAPSLHVLSISRT